MIKTFGSVAELGYSHLLDEERDQLAVMKAAGHSLGAIARTLGRAKSFHARCAVTLCPAADIRRFTPPEPINCAGDVKLFSKKIKG